MKQAFVIGGFLLLCSALAAYTMPYVEQPETVVTDAPAVTVEDEAVQALAPVSPAAEEETQTYDETVSIKVLLDGAVESMSLNDYVAGVVAAEMPASFEPEALKAQAVAARTNVMRKLAYGSKHGDADICGESTCCMGWKQPESEVFRQAVEETDGLVVSYDGAIIDAVFFSSSWGNTEDAVEVWGSAVPYLTAVESPETEIRTETVTIPLTEFCLAVREYSRDADFSGDWLTDVSRTDAGAVKTAVLGGVELTGPQIRSLFGLKSACFDMELTASGVEFTTYGYGHGVGMSQYGANEMARSGSDYQEILTWYYTGCTVEKLGA